MDSLLIPDKIMSEMLEHCRRAYPNEACGILAGSGNRAERIFPAENVNPSPYSYEMSSTGQMRILREIKTSGLSVVAIYHSHPESAPYPSSTDRARAFFPGTEELNYPDAAYVIISLLDNRPASRAFLIGKQGITEIPVKSS